MTVYKRDRDGRIIPKGLRSRTPGSWYFDFQIRGRRYREAIPEAQNQEQALRAESAAKEDVYAGRYNMRRSPVFADFVRRVYLPLAEQNKRSYGRSDAIHAPVLIKFFGRYQLAEITPLLIERFKRERREGVTVRGTIRAPASVNRELETLSRIFSVAIENGHLDANPCRAVRKLRQNNTRTRYLTPDEEERLRIACEKSPGYLWPLIQFAIQTGMRRGELFALRWDDIDLGRGLIHVRDTKSGRDRVVPLSSRARAVLENVRRAGERVFPLSDVKKAFGAALRRAGIRDFRFHDLRHTAATRWAEAGADIQTIAALLGHSTLQMAMRYTHPQAEQLRKAVEM